jgi:hypothetical protein
MQHAAATLVSFRSFIYLDCQCVVGRPVTIHHHPPGQLVVAKPEVQPSTSLSSPRFALLNRFDSFACAFSLNLLFGYKILRSLAKKRQKCSFQLTHSIRAPISSSKLLSLKSVIEMLINTAVQISNELAT